MFSADAGGTDPRPTRLAGWLGLAAFAVFLAAGLVIRLPVDPAIAVPGVLVAVAGAIPLFLIGSSLMLVYAAVATAGVAVLVSVGSGSGNVGWFAVCVIAGWCALAGGWRVGTIFWAASVVLFGVEALVTASDPGWASWIAGVTLTTVGAVLIRRQVTLMHRLKLAQAALIEQSRADERNRIAAELHDIIAHSLTVALLHISSARLALDEDPADAARALAEAERLGRHSLAEVRATMGLARSGTANEIAPPAPDIANLPTLIEQLGAAGVDVHLVDDRRAADMPATTGSTVYRIVQEALTNAAKHAPGARVAVAVAERDGRLEVSIDSSGPPGHGRGIGLTSMRDRAEAVGGTCAAGPGGTGWLVQASLPLQTTDGDR